MGKKRRLPERLPQSIQKFFPNLANYVISSPKDKSYNCVAYAAGDTTTKWDPGMLPHPGYFWPAAALQSDDNESIDALKRAFAVIGYVECEDGQLEAGYQKVALYAIKNDDWLHAPRQEPHGEWSSKLGSSFDIRHRTPQCIEGPAYGNVVSYMKKLLEVTM